MGYFQIGLILSIIYLFAIPYLTLKNRWFEDDLLEGLYEWWDGDDFDDVDLTGFCLAILILLLGVMFNIIVWGLILPSVIIAWFISSIRNKRLIKNK